MLVPPQQLILINVSEKCLERRDPESFPQGVRYLALSYNWGKVDQLLATTENLDLLSSPNALERPDFHTKIPQVIQDAMRFVEGLGESYLWVDALCIVQDDIDEKQKQIAQMGSIYSNALCTIIALAGLDANTRLAGISLRRVHVDDLKEPVDHGHLLISLLGSRYMERAWTFQERILSRRCLYFTAYGVWFQCKRHVVREKVFHSEPESTRIATGISFGDTMSSLDPLYTLYDARELVKTDASISRTIDQAKSHALWFGCSLGAFMGAVTEYSGKNLTSPADILLAFMGFESALRAEIGWHMIFGIPIEAIGIALLWAPPRRIRRRVLSFVPGAATNSQPPRIPTWSWAAWSGSVDYRLVPFAAVANRQVEWEFDSITLKSDNGSPEEVVLKVDTSGWLTNMHWHPSDGLNKSSLAFNVLSMSTFTVPASSFTLGHFKRRRIPLATLDHRQIRTSETLIFNSTPWNENQLCGAFFGPENFDKDLDLSRCEIISLAQLTSKKDTFELPKTDQFQGLSIEQETYIGGEDADRCIMIVLLAERRVDGEHFERIAIGKMCVSAFNGEVRERKGVNLV